jgi:FkbM family methyltransferase
MRIYDIGANVGRFTEDNINKYKDCEFILVEANPVLCDLLDNKFKEYENIKIVNMCVSSVDNEELDFFISEADTISTASKEWIDNSRFNNYKYFEPIKSKSITIESLISQYGKSDYTKIDVEGYEKIVILGIKKNIGLISFEWAEELKEDIKESILHLYLIGYKEFYISYSDEYTFIPNNFSDYDSLKSEVDSLDISRKEKWGMIFAK